MSGRQNSLSEVQSSLLHPSDWKQAIKLSDNTINYVTVLLFSQSRHRFKSKVMAYEGKIDDGTISMKVPNMQGY